MCSRNSIKYRLYFFIYHILRYLLIIFLFSEIYINYHEFLFQHLKRNECVTDGTKFKESLQERVCNFASLEMGGHPVSLHLKLLLSLPQ